MKSWKRTRSEGSEGLGIAEGSLHLNGCTGAGRAFNLLIYDLISHAGGGESSFNEFCYLMLPPGTDWLIAKAGSEDKPWGVMWVDFQEHDIYVELKIASFTTLS